MVPPLRCWFRARKISGPAVSAKHLSTDTTTTKTKTKTKTPAARLAVALASTLIGLAVVSCGSSFGGCYLSRLPLAWAFSTKTGFCLGSFRSKHSGSAIPLRHSCHRQGTRIPTRNQFRHAITGGVRMAAATATPLPIGSNDDDSQTGIIDSIDSSNESPRTTRTKRQKTKTNDADEQTNGEKMGCGEETEHSGGSNGSSSTTTNNNNNNRDGDPLLVPIPNDILTSDLRNSDGSPLELPTKLAYPFWYDPHPIAKWAAERLKEELPPYHSEGESGGNEATTTTASIALGKMYGVLVVRVGNTEKETNNNGSHVQNDANAPLGYLRAYSGTMPRPQYGGDQTTAALDSKAGFCPLVYNRFERDSDGFSYEEEEEILNGYTSEIERLESCGERSQRETLWVEMQTKLRNQLSEAKKKQKSQKRERKERRKVFRKKLLDGRSGSSICDTLRSMTDKESHRYFLEHSEEYRAMEEELVQESALDQRKFKTLKAGVQDELQRIEGSLAEHHSELEDLKRLRREGSIHLQRRLFEHYHLKNAHYTDDEIGRENQQKTTSTPLEIFRDTPLRVPPAGTGDCAAIKLFQHAFGKGYTPVALAEFWWGPSPHNSQSNDFGDGIGNDVARTHGNYYPCCRGKCEPILTRHMLIGTRVESDPLTEGLARSWSEKKERQKHQQQSQGGASPFETTPVAPVIPLEIVFEDEWMVVVNKPHDVLSVPGRTVPTSIQTELQKRANAGTETDAPRTFPKLVHRLDYSTSGLLLAAKDAETHKQLQAQFIERTVRKRYTALLEGELLVDNIKRNYKFNSNNAISDADGNTPRSSTIDLPLAGDYLNRPMQKVERGPEGKPAVTRFEIVASNDDGSLDTQKPARKRTRVHFYPLTGRTHQLRVHASHPEGLGLAIVGDDIYGVRDERLCLHAGFLQIVHPHTMETLTFEAKDPF
ncbi:unnamed protein product [Pseudo-nitzschia multistriata]|uniref:Pseudouridine synthase RsuA/RluA-like domain-containing protein n=1 Tax=Pseudo-nitzschia multistriata TaxID=183589 RepID=A0A448Z977_9STRA|nr:unnamed protein product [Pseudo-nitzschia multistriata]